MKKYILLFPISISVLFILTISCDKMLEEQPRTILTPNYFESKEGLKAGLTSVYSGLRFLYGSPGSLESHILGTDEYQATDMLNGTELAMNNYNVDLNPSNSQVSYLWNNSFPYINTSNGVIELGVNADMPDLEKQYLIAEAKFLRAHYYFLLVQMYGPVPLDLGSGNLKFNKTPSTSSVRSPIADVYAAIIEDLEDAVAELPLTPTEVGRAGQGAALHFLAKAYLTRAGTSAQQSTDYENALYYADELIQNQEVYGAALHTDFANVNLEGNENEPEVLFNIQKTSNDVYGEYEEKPNMSMFYMTPGYENVKIEGITLVERSVEYQRPWRCFVPTPWLLNVAFAERINDSRFDNTFRMMWQCNNAEAEAVGMSIGDTAIFLPGREVTEEERAQHNYVMYVPSQYYMNSVTEYMYPHIKKFDDVTRDEENDYSDRPYLVAKLSETYLMAAEALIMMNRKSEALPYINTIRQRAAYRAANTELQNEAAVEAMTITDENILDIDFILDERSRELCAEQLRWFDLVRTGKLLERVIAHNEAASTRIQPYHVLRPIPQTQIDLLSDPEQKAIYQNEGY